MKTAILLTLLLSYPADAQDLIQKPLFEKGQFVYANPYHNWHLTIIQVMGKGEALIKIETSERTYKTQEFTAHLTGFNTTNWVDDSEHKVSSTFKVVCDGTFSYTTVSGARRTVFSFRKPTPAEITKMDIKLAPIIAKRQEADRLKRVATEKRQAAAKLKAEEHRAKSYEFDRMQEASNRAADLKKEQRKEKERLEKEAEVAENKRIANALIMWQTQFLDLESKDGKKLFARVVDIKNGMVIVQETNSKKFQSIKFTNFHQRSKKYIREWQKNGKVIFEHPTNVALNYHRE